MKKRTNKKNLSVDKKNMKEFIESVQLVADVFGLHAYVVDGKVTIGEFKPNESRNRKNR